MAFYFSPVFCFSIILSHSFLLLARLHKLILKFCFFIIPLLNSAHRFSPSVFALFPISFFFFFYFVGQKSGKLLGCLCPITDSRPDIHHFRARCAHQLTDQPTNVPPDTTTVKRNRCEQPEAAAQAVQCPERTFTVHYKWNNDSASGAQGDIRLIKMQGHFCRHICHNTTQQTCDWFPIYGITEIDFHVCFGSLRQSIFL